MDEQRPDFEGMEQQLMKFAEDLTRVYREEQERSRELAEANNQLNQYAQELSMSVRQLRQAHRELRMAHIDTIQRLAKAAEYRDEDTGDHIVRMSRYSAAVATRMGLGASQVERILAASPMHDVGKIGVPDNILLKPGSLTDEEFNAIKAHSTIGAKILSGSGSEILMAGEVIALRHHEKWNGRGYPDGLKGEEIPLIARIVAVADVFDALTTRRPYKEPFSVEKALNIIKEERGEHFDPDVVDAFLEGIDEILRIKSDVENMEEISLGDFIQTDEGD